MHGIHHEGQSFISGQTKGDGTCLFHSLVVSNTINMTDASYDTQFGIHHFNLMVITINGKYLNMLHIILICKSPSYSIDWPWFKAGILNSYVVNLMIKQFKCTFGKMT